MGTKRKPKHLHKRKGPKPRQKTQEEIEKEQSKKTYRPRDTSQADTPVIKELAISDKARLLVYAKEGRTPPPKVVAPTSTESVWKNDNGSAFRPPTVLKKKIGRTPPDEVVGAGGCWIGLPVHATRHRDDY